MQVPPLCTVLSLTPYGILQKPFPCPFITASVRAFVPHTTLFWPGNAASVSPLPPKPQSSSRGTLLYPSSCHVTHCTARSRPQHGMPGHQLPASPRPTHCAFPAVPLHVQHLQSGSQVLYPFLTAPTPRRSVLSENISLPVTSAHIPVG